MQSREAPLADRPDAAFRRQYETLRALLRGNGTALRLMADLEADLGHLGPAEGEVLRSVERLADEALLMAQELNLLTDDRHRALYGVVEGIRTRIREAVAALPQAEAQPLTVRLDAEAAFASAVGGGKTAGLAALRQVDPDLVPDGFAVTTAAYRLFIRENDLAGRIRMLLEDLDVMTDHPRFRERTAAIRELILAAPVPAPIREAIDREAALTAGGTDRWAVRSSALSEGEGLSFAGQFDSRLNVAAADLADAYRAVLASRFSDRAVAYRLHFGFREADTPMAVLLMPMIPARAAGAIYTRDPRDPASGAMVLCAVPGLADRMIRGEEEAEIHHVRLAPGAGEADTIVSPSGRDREGLPVLSSDDAEHVARVAGTAVRAMGCELDIEWAFDGAGRLRLLQARRLHLPEVETARERGRGQEPPLLERGYTLFPGRAEGLPQRLREGAPPRLAHRAPVLVVDTAAPEYAPLLPRIAALLVAGGNPVGHLAALVREFRVPALIGIGAGADLFTPDEVVSVDATKRRVFRGSRWPGVRERVLSRIAAAAEERPESPLHELALALNLTDAYAPDFKDRNCRSLHDVVRFVHEMSVRAMFRFGDRQNRFWRRTVKSLDSRLPLKLKLLDLDGSTRTDCPRLAPEAVGSRPFRALYRGIADERITWRKRTIRDLLNFPPDFVESVLGGTRGPRRRNDANYAVVARDYLNLNARFVFHYAMLDAIVGDEAERNHVHVRFRGGGASDERRALRARFLELVLHGLHFGVDRRGDLVTAWLRNQTPAESEFALEMLGRLMACARQLDMVLTDDDMAARHARMFLDGDYAAFA